MRTALHPAQRWRDTQTCPLILPTNRRRGNRRRYKSRGKQTWAWPPPNGIPGAKPGMNPGSRRRRRRRNTITSNPSTLINSRSFQQRHPFPGQHSIGTDKIVISSLHAVTKGMRTRPGQLTYATATRPYAMRGSCKRADAGIAFRRGGLSETIRGLDHRSPVRRADGLVYRSRDSHI